MKQNKISFFIVGYPRSGTTMAASLLTRNPDIYIPPETQFFRSFMHELPKVQTKETLINAFIENKRLSDIGVTHSHLKNFSPKKHQITWLLNTALEIKAKELNKSIIGEKTPAHLLHFKEIINNYPDSKFIVIIRDGRDCVLSNIKEKWTFSNPVKHAAEWNLYMNNYCELINKYPDKVLTIRYEDILDTPSDSVKKITEFVGATFNTKQMEKDESKSVIPEWEKNWKAKASEAPDKQNKYKWKLHQNKALLMALTFIMEKHLNTHSYDTLLTHNLSAPRRAYLYIRYFIYMPKIYPIIKKLASTSIYKSLKHIQS